MMHILEGHRERLAREALEARLAALEELHRRVARTTPADSWAAMHGDLWSEIPRAEKRGLLRRTRRGFDWLGKQSHLLHWVYMHSEMDWNDWQGLARFMTVKGKVKTARQFCSAFNRLGAPPRGLIEV